MLQDNIPGLHYSPRRTQEEKNRREHKLPASATKITNYLVQTYNVDLPAHFVQELNEALSHSSHSSNFGFSLEMADVIVKACRMWTDYVEDINSLICHEVLSMARIHVSVIWARSLLRDGFTLKREIPPTRETVINSMGRLSVSR